MNCCRSFKGITHEKLKTKQMFHEWTNNECHCFSLPFSWESLKKYCSFSLSSRNIKGIEILHFRFHADRFISRKKLYKNHLHRPNTRKIFRPQIGDLSLQTASISYQIFYRLLKSDNVALVMLSHDPWVLYRHPVLMFGFGDLASNFENPIEGNFTNQTNWISYQLSFNSTRLTWKNMEKTDALSSLRNHHWMNCLKKRKWIKTRTKCSSLVQCNKWDGNIWSD